MEQLATRINTIQYKNVNCNHAYVCEATVSMQYRPQNAQDVSNINHFGSVSDSLGQLAAASECMASKT